MSTESQMLKELVEGILSLEEGEFKVFTIEELVGAERIISEEMGVEVEVLPTHHTTWAQVEVAENALVDWGLVAQANPEGAIINIFTPLCGS